MNSIGTDCPLNSGGSGLNGAVNSIALIAALSAKGTPDDFVTLWLRSLPSLAIVNVMTTLLELSPLGGDQFLFILCSRSLIYGPQLGCLIASIPGAPFGLPGPGFPPVPCPPCPRLAYLFPPEPEPPLEPPELPEEPEPENLGAGADEPPVPDELPPPEAGEPAGL